VELAATPPLDVAEDFAPAPTLAAACRRSKKK
jgi:hypothetical protein